MTTLKRLLPAHDIDALLGDIVEESRRRSRLWFWLQLAAVLFVGSYRDVRRHRLAALRAIGVGVLALVVAFVPAPSLLHAIRVMSEGAGYHVGAYWLTLPPNAFQYFPAVVNVLAFASSGWAIARYDRAHGIAMVMPWALLVCVLPAYVTIDFLTYHGPSIVWTGPRTLGLMSTISLPACVLLGGTLGVGRRNRVTDHRSTNRR
jgi:hypothetical protein